MTLPPATLSTVKLKHLDTSAYVRGHDHGRSAKDLVVLHETVGPDIPGLDDIIGVEKYLASKDYGIHGMTDLEGNIAWADSYSNAIFWQCGGVNERSVGIEQVSWARTDAHYWIGGAGWTSRGPELRATAKLLAAIHNTMGIPLVFSDGHRPGVTGHWCVAQWSPRSEGHRDCRPRHLGGNYPILSVINIARTYAKLPHYTLY